MKYLQITLILLSCSLGFLSAQVENLEVEGAIKIGNSTSSEEGTIRFDGDLFEGFASGEWRPFALGQTSPWLSNENGYYLLENVGIGRAATSARLILQDNSRNSFTIRTSDNSASNGMAFQNSGGAYSWNIFRENNENPDADFVIAGGEANTEIAGLPERLRIVKNGNIGIGTAIPREKLHVEGRLWLGEHSSGSGLWLQSGESANDWFVGARADNDFLRIFNYGDGDLVVIKPTNGYVGVNRSNPQTRLHVGGLMRSSYDSSSGEYVEMWHGGAHGYINTVGDGNLEFRHDGDSKMKLTSNAQLLVGDVTPINGYNLIVENGILTEEVKVALKNSADWSDDAWDLVPGIAEVKASIEEKSHLVDMPSADQLVKTGYSVTDMDSKLLAQIEWLWLHVIDMKDQIDELSSENAKLKERLQETMSEKN